MWNSQGCWQADMVCAGLICTAVSGLQGACWLPCTAKKCEASVAVLTSHATWRAAQPSDMTFKHAMNCKQELQRAMTLRNGFHICQFLPDVTTYACSSPAAPAEAAAI